MKRIRNFLVGIAAVMLASSSLLATETPVPIPLGASPLVPEAIAYDPVNDHLYVLEHRDTGTSSSGFVHIVDARTNTFIRVLQMGRDSKTLSVDGYNNKIYVMNYLDNTIGIIDGRTDLPLTDGNGNVKTVSLPVHPAAIAFSYYSGYTYVSYHQSTGNSPAVAVLDGVTDTIIGTITGFGKEISGLLWPVNGGLSHLIFALGSGTPATVYSIQPFGGGGSVIRAVDVGNVPGPSLEIRKPMAGENSRAATYVVNIESNTVTEIDPDQVTTTTIPVPERPAGIAGEDNWATGGGHVYVACQRAGVVVEITGHAVTRSWGGFKNPNAVQYNPQDHSLYIADAYRLYVLHL